MIQRKRTAGFTLYELMVTVAVASVIASFGIPTFQGMVQNNRAVTHTNDVVTAMNLARSEAMRRSAQVEVCASSNGTTCSNSLDWSNGWIVQTPAGVVLRVWPARSGGAGVLTANVSRFQFQARGALAPGALPNMNVQLPYCTGDQRRNVSVNVAGRISVNRVACP